MKVALACDHGGLSLKNKIKEHLAANGYETVDFGTTDACSCDYPDFALLGAEAVARGECDRGIFVCTTGIGISIAANKVPGIRCALCTDETCARLTREHNDANVLALGGGIVGEHLALGIVDVFLTTGFSGLEKHQRRIDKIAAIEKKYSGSCDRSVHGKK